MNWPLVPLAEVAGIERHAVQPSSIERGTRYVGLEHIESGGHSLTFSQVTNGELASTKFRFGPQHILFGKLRPYLAKIVCPDFDGICSTDILPILPGPDLDHRYLAHFLRHPRTVDWAAARATGINLPRLSPTQLASLQIPLPPLEEQRRIAAILDKADALRRTRKRTAELLDGLTQSIFLEMFGDPVTNPKALKSRSLGDLDVDMSYGPRFYNEKYSDDGIRIVRITDLSDTGHLKFEDMPQLTLPAEEIARHRSFPGDILFARTGATVGKWRSYQRTIHPISPVHISSVFASQTPFILHSLHLHSGQEQSSGSCSRDRASPPNRTSVGPGFDASRSLCQTARIREDSRNALARCAQRSSR